VQGRPLCRDVWLFKKRRFLFLCVDAGSVCCMAMCGCSSLSSWMALALLVVVALVVVGCVCGGCGDA
jgi:hypothetical protein